MTQLTSRNKQPCRQRHWQAHVKALKQSGLSRAEYCRQHHLSYHAITYWQRKLSSGSNSSSALVPIPFVRSMEPSSIQPDRAALKVILPGRMSVEVGDDFLPATLTRLLATLASR